MPLKGLLTVNFDDTVEHPPLKKKKTKKKKKKKKKKKEKKKETNIDRTVFDTVKGNPGSNGPKRNKTNENKEKVKI